MDNDGWPDIFLVNGHVYPEVDGAALGLSFRQPKVLYRNRGGGTFEDVSKKLGPPITTPSVGRGCAFGDFDNDGDIDIVINNMHDTPSLLRLNSRNKNRPPLEDIWNGFRKNIESFKLRAAAGCLAAVILVGRNLVFIRTIDNSDGAAPMTRRFEVPRRKDNKATKVFVAVLCPADELNGT